MRIIICGLEKDAAAVEQPRSFFGEEIGARQCAAGYKQEQKNY
jgi:hypothetical protein